MVRFVSVCACVFVGKVVCVAIRLTITPVRISASAGGRSQVHRLRGDAELCVGVPSGLGWWLFARGGAAVLLASSAPDRVQRLGAHGEAGAARRVSHHALRRRWHRHGADAQVLSLRHNVLSSTEGPRRAAGVCRKLDRGKTRKIWG